MNNIKITLQNNKKYDAVNLDNIDILEDENNATSIDIEFPKEYENYSKRIDFMNIRREKWTTRLYAPEECQTQWQKEGNYKFSLLHIWQMELTQ